MIDEKKVIEEIQDHIEKERTKCNQMVELGLDESVAKYNHGEYCYVNALHLVQSQPKVGEWVSVDERLPNKDGYFLITTSDNEIDIREYLYSKGWGWDGFERVIAWQPLPEPYRKDVE